MSILDNLPELVAKTAGEMLFKDATLTRASARIPNGRGGYTTETEIVPIRALVTDYSDYLKTAGGIPADHRKILIQQHELQNKIEQGEKITIDGRDWTIVSLSEDPANALYEAQVK